MKATLLLVPVLHGPEISKAFTFHCDASQYGTGAVFVQKVEKGGYNWVQVGKVDLVSVELYGD